MPPASVLRALTVRHIPRGQLGLDLRNLGSKTLFLLGVGLLQHADLILTAQELIAHD